MNEAFLKNIFSLSPSISIHPSISLCFLDWIFDLVETPKTVSLSRGRLVNAFFRNYFWGVFLNIADFTQNKKNNNFPYSS